MGFSEHFKRHGVVHMSWVIAVLVAIIVGLLTSSLGTNDSIKDILNFSVALASLVLALVAIVQALVSGGAMNDAAAKVTGALASIEQPASQLAAASTIIGRHSETIGSHAAEIRERAQAMAQAPVESVVKVSRTYSADEVLPITNETVRLALYLILRSFETARPIDASMLEYDIVRNWINGYVMALATMSIIGMKGFTVLDLGPLHWLVERRDELRETSSQYAEQHAKQFEAIDAFYG